jgi:uncharacterized protein
MKTTNLLCVVAGLVIYIISVLYLHIFFEQPLSDFLIISLIVGIGFSLIAWFLLRKETIATHRPALKNELILVMLLLVWIVLYTTWGAATINRIIPGSWLNNEKINSLVIVIRKLIVFIAVPYIIYRFAGFTKQDFGFSSSPVKFFSKRGIATIIALSSAILLFQYFLSNGSKPIRNGEISIQQLSVALPLTFLWLFIEAGLVEEFFYRVILQSRLSVLLKSSTGGIVISALIFGLSHAPGLYLRGAESEGVGEQLPFLFWSAYTIAFMSVAGIFLAIVWQRTKNIWIIIFLHAMVDLLPNTDDFIRTWFAK